MVVTEGRRFQVSGACKRPRVASVLEVAPSAEEQQRSLYHIKVFLLSQKQKTKMQTPAFF
jgi:hypothetical protein